MMKLLILITGLSISMRLSSQNIHSNTDSSYFYYRGAQKSIENILNRKIIETEIPNTK
jgi:hypothetical protein